LRPLLWDFAALRVECEFAPVVHIEQLAGDDTHRKFTSAFLQSVMLRGFDDS
jgi:hypothetical protein